MRTKALSILTILVLLSLSGCGIRNWFVANNDADADMSQNNPTESNQEIVGNHHSGRHETPVSSVDTLLLQDSTIAIGPYRATPLADSILSYARLFLKRPYVRGGNGPDVFDCSGFTKFVFSHFGFKLNRTSEGQMANGTPIKRQSDLRPGDLVFYGGHKTLHSIRHVGIVVNYDTISQTFTFIHACYQGVSISKSSEKYYAQRYISACRVIADDASISSNPNDITYTPILPKVKETKSTAQSTAKYHVIKKGDTLTKIAKQYGTTVGKLCEINHINKNKILTIGKKIRVK